MGRKYLRWSRIAFKGKKYPSSLRATEIRISAGVCYQLPFLCKQGIYAFLSFPQIYFRIHVSVLKLLFDKYPDVDVSVLEEHLQRASQGPFYHAEFDTDVGQGTVYRSESTTSGVCNASLYQAHTVLFIKD